MDRDLRSKTIKKFAFILLFWPCSYYMYAQKQGLLKYKTITVLSDTNNKVVRSYSMFFDQNESIAILTQAERDGKDTTIHVKKIDKDKPAIYKSFANNITLASNWAFMQDVLVKDSIIHFDWKIGKETRQIADYKCLKAEMDFRGRHYIAWFTPDIPISNGPWKLQGLPGLILDAYDKNKEVRFEFEALFLPVKPAIKIEPLVASEKEKVVSFVEYAALFRKNVENFVKMTNTDPEITKQGGNVKIEAKPGIEIFPEK
jgi:GLPGLI family protein